MGTSQGPHEAIELAWAQVKSHIKANTSRFKLDEVEDLAWKGFEKVTLERWADLLRHVRDKDEDHYWENDRLHLQEQFCVDGEFVLPLSGESSDESDDEALSEGTFLISSSLTDIVVASDNDEDV